VDLPALKLVDAEVKAAVEVLERRSDNLDTKAGLCLGFAGVLAGILLRAGFDSSAAAYVALGNDFLVAALSLLGYRTRSKPVLNPRQLRRYIEGDEASVRLVLLDTRVLQSEEFGRRLRRQATLINAALVGLLLAVTATAIAAVQSLGGVHGVT
jgi:hypothetical protein